MADDGYLIGFEDSSGNFIEVGRFNNLSGNTSDPVFIEHTGSGTRMELDGSGFDMNGGDITNAGSVSTAALDTSNGYLWSDYTSNRSFGTWYQAPSDRDILFSFSIQTSSDSTAIDVIVDIDASQSVNEVQRQRLSLDNTDEFGVGEFRVPADQYYRVRAFGDTADYILEKWNELR